MSAKTFKKTRRLARDISKGQPAYALLGHKHSVKRGKREYTAVQAVVSPSCTRGVYLQLKKLLRRGMTIAQLEASIRPQLAARGEGEGNAPAS